MTGQPNYSLRDEIRDYWSARAETFDLSVGHEIFSEAERNAWHRLILKHLGSGEGRRALDIACGTGVVSHLMHDLGFAVAGLDWSEAMLAKAREGGGAGYRHPLPARRCGTHAGREAELRRYCHPAFGVDAG